MSISSTNRVAGPFVGDGSTATFPFTFKAFDQSDVLVLQLDTSTGATSTLALTADYTVTLNADQDTSPGGSITLTAGNLAAGYDLTITTAMAALQGLDLTNGGGFYPDVINAALDTLTILIQQMQTALNRTMQAPLAEAAPTFSLPPAAERAGTVLMFDGNGNVTLIPMAAGGTVPGSQGAVGNVDGANKSFTFTAASTTTPAPLVFAGGIYQTPGEDYEAAIAQVSASTWEITFLVAPTQGPITIVLLA